MSAPVPLAQTFTCAHCKKHEKGRAGRRLPAGWWVVLTRPGLALCSRDCALAWSPKKVGQVRSPLGYCNVCPGGAKRWVRWAYWPKRCPAHESVRSTNVEELSVILKRVYTEYLKTGPGLEHVQWLKFGRRRDRR